MYEIFIAYATSDKKIAFEVCSALEERGISCWIAPRNVPPGREYAESIVDATNRVNIMVLVFSSAANQSRQVKAEIQAAFDRGIIILPLRIEDVQPTGAMKHYISTFHWLDAFTPPLKKHLVELAEWIHDILETEIPEQPEKEPSCIANLIARNAFAQKLIEYLYKYRIAIAACIFLIAVGIAVANIIISQIQPAQSDSQQQGTSASLNKPFILTSGGRNEDGPGRIAVDNSHNIYIAGSFEGTVNLGPGPDSKTCTSSGERDAYFMKLDPSGAMQWARTWGGTGLTMATGMVIDGDRNTYIVGEFSGITDFNPGPGVLTHSAQGSADSYIIMFDANGSLQWVKTWGGLDRDAARSVILDLEGNIHIIGCFGGAIDLDPGEGTLMRTTRGNMDSYFVKLDSSGSLQWAYTWGSTGHDEPHDITLDATGNIYIAGFTGGAVDFGSDNISLDPFGDSDACLIKLDPSGSLQWARNWGGTGFDNANSIALDDMENIYIGGGFEGAADLDPGSGKLLRTSQGERDFFLIKLDPSGPLQWVKTWGGPGKSLNLTVTINNSDEIYIESCFKGAANLGGGSVAYTSRGGTDPFLTKFDPSGSLQWTHTWGGLDNDSAGSMAFDNSGNILILGTFGGTADLDPGPGTAIFTAQGYASTYLIKTDSSGSLQWGKTWGSFSNNYALGISVDKSDNVYLADRFGGMADLDPGPGISMLTSQRGDDAYLVKLEPTGSTEWIRTWGGSEEDFAYKVALDDSGSAYIAGCFQGTADLDPGPASLMRTAQSEFPDAYLIKLDASGLLQWARDWGGQKYDYANGVAIDGMGNAYVSGSFQDTADLDPGSGVLEFTAYGDSHDSYLVKLDSSGLLHWAKTWGGPDKDSAEDVAVDQSNNIYVVGSFKGAIDLDPGLGEVTHNGQGEMEAYLIKLDANGSLQWSRTWGGPGSDHARGVACDSTGNIYVVGYFDDTADFDPGPDVHSITSQGNFDSYLMKLNPDGDLLYASTWGGTDFDEARKVAIDKHGNIYIVGFFIGTMDLDPGPGTYLRTAQGRDDDYVIKLDNEGNLIR